MCCMLAVMGTLSTGCGVRVWFSASSGPSGIYREWRSYDNGYVIVVRNMPRKKVVYHQKIVYHYAHHPSVSSGYYIRPVDGVVTQGLHGNGGVDFRAAVGTPVRAAAEGVVRFAGWNRYGSGNKIVISHPNGTETVYCHLSRFLVRAGDHVEQGRIIALSGDTGIVTGPHLHFGVHGAPNPFANEVPYAQSW